MNSRKTIKRKINKIEPFREFWIDCYSTGIFSVIQTNFDVEKSFFYNNNYTYEFTKNVRTGMGRVYINMQLEDIINKFLVNKEIHDFTVDEDIVENLKFYIDSEKIIFLGIDMYYGVPDTSQWHKHHVNHTVLVEGYDDEKECVYILESGEKEYKSYEVSYTDITIAAKEFICYVRDTEIFEINQNEEVFMYDCSDIKNNAIEIVKSIDDILSHMNEIWHINPDKLLSMKDEIEAHLKAIRNRQGVNVKLFASLYGEMSAQDYIERFLELEKEYNLLRDTIIHLCVNNEYYENEEKVKNTFAKLLSEEKKIWQEYCRKGILD